MVKTISVHEKVGTELSDAKAVASLIFSLRDDAQSDVLMRFFKTGKGEYGEGDAFLGVKVPTVRQVVRRARHLPLTDVHTLLLSPWHEVRLSGLLIVVEKMRHVDTSGLLDDQEKRERRQALLDFYLGHARHANNWDLVDVSAPHILGTWLAQWGVPTEEEKMRVLDRLMDSSCLWEQRMAMVSTMTPTRRGCYSYVLHCSERLMSHPHDLMHKAVGWMLRELGKGDIHVLRAFLGTHHASLNRTTLRYAIERMDADERQYWLKLDKH